MITSRHKPKQCIFQSRTENKNLRKFFLNVWIKWVRIDRRKYIRRLPRVRVRPIDSMKTYQVSPTFTVDIWMCWNWNRSASPCPFQGRTRIFVRFMLKVNFLHSRRRRRWRAKVHFSSILYLRNMSHKFVFFFPPMGDYIQIMDHSLIWYMLKHYFKILELHIN